MEALAPCVAETCRKLLDRQYLLPWKPDFVVGKCAISHCAAEHFIDAIAAQVAVAFGVLSGKAVIHIEVRAADEGDHVTVRLPITLHIFIRPCSC